eukprot:TRINITY_DN58240_c0_g1_i1.p1 TRINITY_DN58240_c0_g1~~TRINITY_DN58240_c0_g1_i1.p1  ORF type:complete len:471 (-),score=63.15 TRINITY_DN58240_c0_g1_i1:109-1521(-)
MQHSATPERKRWAVLFLLLWAGWNQGSMWMTFSGSPDALRELLPGIEVPDSEIDLLLNWGPIMYLPSSLGFLWYMQRHPAAVYDVIACCQVFSVLSNIRMIPLVWDHSPHFWLNVGQSFTGLAGPISASVAPAFAAVWFPPSERTMATSLIYGAQGCAPGLGFFLALFISSAQDLRLCMILQGVSSVAACCIWLTCVPRMPADAPSASAAMRRERSESPVGTSTTSWASVQEFGAVMLQNRYFLLAIGGGFIQGSFQCWASSLTVILNEESGELGFGKQTGTVLSLLSNLIYYFGTLAAVPLGEKFFPYRYRQLLLILSVIQCAMFTIFAFALPGLMGPDSPPAIPLAPGALLAVLCAASFLVGLSGPICFELGAEITYPAPEGIGGTALTFTGNGGGLLLLAAMSMAGNALEGASGCLLMAMIVFVCFLLLFPVKEVYARAAIDVGENCRQLEALTAPCKGEEAAARAA